ncbi:uncharacterized protein [Littorina saxatilis]|uniref:uncharacterized protein isoform X2 n=1 Tax=Littorina saxatilis TaxID=31220 RepID=UPI0038B54282
MQLLEERNLKMSSSYQGYGQVNSQDYSQSFDASGSYSSTQPQPQYGSVEQYSSATDGSYDYTQYTAFSTGTGTESCGYNPTTGQYDQSYSSNATPYQGAYDQYSSSGTYDTSQAYGGGTYNAVTDSSNSYSGSYPTEYGYTAETQYGTGDTSQQYAPTQYVSGSSTQYGTSDQYPSSSQYSTSGNAQSVGTGEQYRAYGSGGQQSSGDMYPASEQYSQYTSSSTQPQSNLSFSDYNQDSTPSYNYTGSENTWQGDNTQNMDSGGGSWARPKSSSHNQASYNQGSQSSCGQGGSYNYKPASFKDPGSDYQGGSGYDRSQGRGSYNNSSEGKGPADSSRGSFNNTRGKASYDSNNGGRGSYSNQGKGSYNNTRGRGSFDNSSSRGRGSYDNSYRGRGSFDNGNRSRGSFDNSSRGRGSFDKNSRGRGLFENRRGRGSFDNNNRGRGSFDKSTEGRGLHNSSASSVRERGGYVQNSRSDNYDKFEKPNQGGPSARGGYSAVGSKNWSRPQETAGSSAEAKSGKGVSSSSSASTGNVQDKSAGSSTNPKVSKSLGGSSQAGAKTATPAKPPTTVSSASSAKGGSKTPVFGSGDREPFSRGTRGKTFTTPVNKACAKALSGTGQSSTARAVTADSTNKQDSKPKSAIQKQAEIALKCAAAFKGVSAPVPEAEIKSTTNATSTAKPTSTTKSVAKEADQKAPDGKKMMEDERAREEEIQRKIKESVVVIPNDGNPTAEEVDKILRAPPAFEVPEHLKEKLEQMTSHTYCKVCSLVLNAPLQAAQHYQGKNHAKRVRLYIASDGNVSASKVTNIMEQGLAAVNKESNKPKTQEGEEKKGETGSSAAVDESKKWECCTLCGVGFTSLKQAEQHYSGKNHAKKVRLSEANACLEKAAEANLVKKGGSNVFECSLCNVMVTSEDQLNTHLKGMKHQNKMKQASGKNRPRGRGRGGFRGGRGGRGGFGQGAGSREEGADFGTRGMVPRGRGRGRGGFQRGRQEGFRGGRFRQGCVDFPMEEAFPSPPRFDEGFGSSPRPGFKRREPFDDFGPPRGKRPRRGF